MSAGASDVVIVGGGVIGLASAWQLAEAGADVTVVDPSPGQGASWAAAGMLAPINEAYWGEESMLRMGLASLERWPGFADQLGADAIGFERSGGLRVAYDADDRAVLDELHSLHEREQLPVQILRSADCRREEPMLASAVRAGHLVDTEYHVDPRRLVAALLDRVPVTRQRVERVEPRRITLDDGAVLEAATVVVAAGAWTAQLIDVPVRPVKGQILRLRGEPGFLRRPVRGIVRGSNVYVVSRADGEIVVGATTEEQGFDTRVTAGGVYELLRDALLLLPGLSELQLVESHAGLRPGTPDNTPVVTELADGLIVASGHYRNGILLTPITAEMVAGLVLERAAA